MTASEVFGETSTKAKLSTFDPDRLLIVSSSGSDPLGPTPPPSPIPVEEKVKKTKKNLAGEDRPVAAITWSPEIVDASTDDVEEDDDDEQRIGGECRLQSDIIDVGECETLDTEFNLSSSPSGGRCTADEESCHLLTTPAKSSSSSTPTQMPPKYSHHGSATILDQIPENEQPTAGKHPTNGTTNHSGRRRSSVAMQDMLSTHRPSTIMSALRRGSLAWLPGRGKSASSSQQGGHEGGDSNMGSKGSLSQMPHGGGAHCELALESRRKNRRIGDDALSTALSALYAKIIVILGIALPVTEILSSQIPANVYQGFYLYLYSVSITFVIFVYASNMRRRAVMTLIKSYQEKTNAFPVKKRVPHFGSFYLRVGAIAFGIGTMVYSGLELGQYFELHASPGCHSIFVVLTPAARMILSIVQMQFIFLNTSELDMARHKVFARFGLMHMIATNLCEWLYILVEETKHEIHHLAHIAEHPKAVSAMVNFTTQILSTTTTTTTTTTTALPHYSSEESSEEDFGGFLQANGTSRHSKRSPVDTTDLSEYIDCQRTNIMGTLVQNASPFLFPCTIEYSLICAVILYEMWKKVKTIAEIDRTRRTSHRLHSVVTNGAAHGHGHHGHTHTAKSAHHFSVDCSRAHRGMFGGIIITVLTIICLIMYFVLHDEPGYEYFALQEVTIAETLLYSVTAAAVIAAMIKMRDLKYCKKQNDTHASSVSLDCTLLVLAQTGVYVYGMFSIVGSYFSIKNEVPGAQEGLIAEIFSLVQTSIQTLFILNAVWRKCRGAQQHRTKPGREIVTFLLVANMAMWFINTLIKGRASFRPSHLDFFGTWAWTVITHVSMPLAIFYRFHSTICLFEVWKATYKVKGGDHHH